METIMINSVLSELFQKERTYLNDFFDSLNLESVERVLEQLHACDGLIVLTGVGKSGLVAKKTAVTMTSTGTRAIYLSPTNALHGDLGILKPQDIFLVFSKSGESDELLNLIPFIRNKGIKMIAVVSNAESRLAKSVDLTLELPHEPELCPFDLAPTTSTTIQSIVADVLAIALMRLKNFTVNDFASLHPAGRLGKRLTMKVKDLMLQGDAVPICKPDELLVDTLVELSNKQCGCVLIVDAAGKMLGIFTDGDLRRSLQNKGSRALESRMEELMTKTPRFIDPDALVLEAMKKMEANQKSPIMVLPVLDSAGHVAGLIKMHDIVQAGI